MNDHGMTIWALEPRFAFEATPIVLDGATSGANTNWSVVMVGAAFDPTNDTQAGKAGTDLVGDADNPLFYTAFDDNGTTSLADDEIGFRVRIGNIANGKDFTAVLLIGIDADADGVLDLFLSADGRQGGAVTIWAPGSGLNTSPSSTSITAPTSQISTAFSEANYALTAVSSASDPTQTSTDIGGDGKTDNFVSFKLSFADFKSEMSRISSITIDQDTDLRYVVMTLTQNNAINGDIGVSTAE